MIALLGKLGRGLRRFWRREDGTGTLEFILVLPGFLLLFTSAYEGGVLSTRHVMLERGLDSTVRDVRIGTLVLPAGNPALQHALLTAQICQYASIIPSCEDNIRLEMVRNDLRNWVDPDAEVSCVDKAASGPPALNLTTGGNNELMILRACVLFDPMIPTSGLGKQIPKKSGGSYALVAVSSYVMEPFQL